MRGLRQAGRAPRIDADLAPGHRRRWLPGPLLPAAAAALLALGLQLPKLVGPGPAAVPAVGSGAAATGRHAATGGPPPRAPSPRPLAAAEGPIPDAAAVWPEPAAGPPASAPADAAGTSERAPSSDTAMACPSTPSAIADVALEARRRRDAVLQRETEVGAREAALQAEAARLDTLKADLDKRQARAKAEDEARTGQLVKVYEAMKPKEAAQVFDQLEMPVLLPIAEHMREVRLAPVLAAMDPAKARAVTVALAQSIRPGTP